MIIIIDIGLKSNLKIAIRKGHNEVVRGASKLIDEVTENTKVLNEAVKMLKDIKNVTVIDCSAPITQNSANKDLTFGVNKANNENADIFISIHFNKAYDKYNGTIGCETLTFGKPFKEAIAVQDKLVELGFKDRGNKERPGLYELRATKMKAMIVEVCFVEATGDVELYKKIGPKAVAKAIVEGVLGKSIDKGQATVDKPSNPKPSQSKDKETYEYYISGAIVKELQKELNSQFNAGLNVDGYFGDKTISKLVTIKRGAKGNITKIIQKRLISKKYKLGSSGSDGIFGANTEKAIKDLQKLSKITVDGIVGVTTWKALFKK